MVAQLPSPSERMANSSSPRSPVDDAAVNEETSTTSSGPNVSNKEEKLKVVVRVRPLQAKEKSWANIAGGEIQNLGLPPPATITIQQNEIAWEKNGQVKVLKANAVFAGGATQDNVFHSVADCVDALIAGFDCSVFAYGQTGTGKTYTMSGLLRDESASVGVHAPMPPSHGVVPRSIDTLFEKVEHEKKEAEDAIFNIYCSFIEIYNEKIYDILSPDATNNAKGNQSPDAKATSGSLMQRARWNSTTSVEEQKSLPIRQKLDGSVFVDGMTSRNVSSKAELLQAFCEGSSNREVRDNLYNQFSSRGHSVFQITLRKTVSGHSANSKQTRLSRLFFVDLAGSEKWHVVGSELTDKYASELASINKSLSALTNCVLALTQKERSHVPFRDSVLTRLLQTCLQGSGRTAFIVTISPSKGSLEESFATLRFAERLKTIRCRPIRRSLFSNEMLGEQRLFYERQIQVMRAEVNRLRELLRKANQKPNSEDASANAALFEENQRLKELLQQSEQSRAVERKFRVERTNDSSEKDGVNNGGVSKMSPQQFSARQMLNPSSLRLDDTITSATDRNLMKKTNLSERIADGGLRSDQLSTLETQLQSKEARLNWMLEAEMEAQNSGTDAPPSNPAIDDGASADPERRPTVTRSWAVETRLRRQLVAVPLPMRDVKPDVASQEKLSPSLENTRQPVGPAPAKRVLPSLDEKAPLSSPRADTGVTQRRRAPSPPDNHSKVNEAIAGSRRSRVGTIARSNQGGRSESTATTTQPDRVKAASILKLVSLGDSTGKTREELVAEYKRARRAELEAMMRTMVQK